MKKLFMKQNIFSVLDRFTVKNEKEVDCYQVHGDFLQIGGKKLHIEDMSGRELAMVQQKLRAIDCVQAAQAENSASAGE